MEAAFQSLTATLVAPKRGELKCPSRAPNLSAVTDTGIQTLYKTACGAVKQSSAGALEGSSRAAAARLASKQAAADVIAAVSPIVTQLTAADPTAAVVLPLPAGNVVVSKLESDYTQRLNYAVASTALQRVTKDAVNAHLAKRRKHAEPDFGVVIADAWRQELQALRNIRTRRTRVVLANAGCVPKRCVTCDVPTGDVEGPIATMCAARQQLVDTARVKARRAECVAAIQQVAAELVRYQAASGVDVQCIVSTNGTRYNFERLHPARSFEHAIVRASSDAARFWNGLFRADGTPDKAALREAFARESFTQAQLWDVASRALQTVVTNGDYSDRLNALDRTKAAIESMLQQEVLARLRQRLDPVELARARVRAKGLEDCEALRIWRAPTRRTASSATTPALRGRRERNPEFIIPLTPAGIPVAIPIDFTRHHVGSQQPKRLRADSTVVVDPGHAQASKRRDPGRAGGGRVARPGNGELRAAGDKRGGAQGK